ncbi:unnamed protein product [Caenorhabditis sp. 36 PRJEB53466]|nr:unnamed protein product [Caenorhabditis sp. 36 PRJEB53466]
MGPQVGIRRRPLDLDAIFGHTMMSLTGEPVTPTKIAIFYLIRTLFHTHFGVRAVPSLKPFNAKEKQKVFTIVYGLIFLKSEISYDDFRNCVRILQNELGRSIYYTFVSHMEKLARGEEALDLLFENAFYTNRRPLHEKVSKADPDHDVIDFMSNKSYLYIWIKRVMIQYSRTSQRGQFEYVQDLQKWLTLGNQPVSRFGLDVVLPLEINCSVRARSWITVQLKLVQMAPSKAMPYNQLIDWCRLIFKHHPDVYNAHLLESVVRIQQKNSPGAIKALKLFFELSMLQLTQNAVVALRTGRLTARTKLSLKYGPILQGRVHRLFGDHQFAGILFGEAIQQAQLDSDDMCNRVANLELTTNEILLSGPIQEKPYKKQDVEDGAGDRRVLQRTIHVAADLDRPNIESMKENFEEAYEMHTFQLSVSKLLLAIEDMMNGKYLKFYRTADYVSVGLHRLRLLFDSNNKARQIEDYATAIMSSGLIQSGMYNQAKRVTRTMMVNNVEAPCTPRLETEAHAVGGVNFVYSLAAEGDYEKAFKVLANLEQIFPDTLNWMCARHVRICSAIVNFEKDFLLHRYAACFSHLTSLETTAPLEYTLRKALLLSATGKQVEAARILKEYKCGGVRGKFRIHMQLATIHTAHGRFDTSVGHLEEAAKIAVGTSFRDANMLVTRRVGSMLLAKRVPIDAYQALVVLNTKVENFGSFIEKAIYYALMARSRRELGRDPRSELKKCKSLISGGKWPAMEKLILTELAHIHSPEGLFPDEQKLAWAKERFGRIETDYPGPCTWLFI